MNHRRRMLRLLPVLAIAVFAGGCASGAIRNIDRLDGPVGQRSVLLMPADVELSELSAGGIPVMNAAWTEAAQTNVSAALENFLAAQDVNLVTFEPRPGDDSPDSIIPQIQKLHVLVSGAARAHGPFAAQPMRLPHKDGKFDWTLGPSVSALRERYQADYVLFVYMRDTYTSAGRAAVVLAFAALGVQVPSGTLLGFATLADARTGDVVWINVLQPQGGQLRDSEAARGAIERLLADFPR